MIQTTVRPDPLLFSIDRLEAARENDADYDWERRGQPAVMHVYLASKASDGQMTNFTPSAAKKLLEI